MHSDLSSVLIPVLFWGVLFVVPLPRSIKVLIGVSALLLGFIGYASAQALPSLPPAFPSTVSGNVTTFGGATTTAANAVSYTFGNVANGPVYAEGAGSIRTASGKVVPVVARSVLPAANVAKAVAGLARAATGVGYVIGVGVALYEVAKSLGFNLDTSSGSLVVTQDSTVVTCNANWQPPTYNLVNSPIFATATRVCIPTLQANSYSYGYSYSGGSVGYTGVTFPCGNSSCPTGTLWSGQGTTSSITRSPATPSTVQALEDAVAARTSWPAGSPVADAVRDAAKYGVPVELPKPSTITGPTEVSSPPKTTTNPDGTKVVETTKEKITYGPDAVSVTAETTRQGFDAMGNPTGTITETSAPAAPKPDPVTCGLPGTPACKIDESGTPAANPITDAVIQQGTDAVKAASESLNSRIVGDADKGWSWTLLGAPPVAQCETVQFPTVMGVTPPVMNPCGTVDGIRAFMAWIWAFVGFYVCIGYVREVV